MKTNAHFLISLLLQISLSACKISDRPIVLVVSFDGFRNSYLSPTRTPTLTDLSLSGATCPYMQPVFPTKTFPNHQSICTGLYPSSHGIVDNIFYDTKYNSTLDGKRNSPGFWNYDPEVLPLWIYNEQQGGTSGCLMWPGSNKGYGPNSNWLPTYYYPTYDQSFSWESRVDMVIGWITHYEKPANLVFMYYNQPDSAGHKYGPYGLETLKQVEETDKRVQLLIQKLQNAGIYDKVNLILLSDHGMEEVTSDRVIDLYSFVDKDDAVEAVNGGSPIIQVVPKNKKSDQLYKQLESAAKTRNFTVLRKPELCNAPYFYCESRRVHRFVMLADPGWAIKEQSYRRRKKEAKVWGSHGYINTVESMQVFLIARGPAFKSGFKTSKPIKNLDIVPLISKIIGIENVPTNGSLERVIDMLK